MGLSPAAKETRGVGMAGTKEAGVRIKCESSQQWWLQFGRKQQPKRRWMHENVIVASSDETKSVTKKQDVFATFVRVQAIA